MQQNRGVGGGMSDQEMKQNQEDRRLKLTADNQQPPAQQQQHQHQPPQKCPRCESVNTKFCYYNNYSLSQPRYFCKACRRYWTQGGTLRNVPVGGGCRKGKRTKTSSSGENSRSSQPQVQKLTAAQTITSSNPIIGVSSGLDSSHVISSMGSYYHHHPGAGFLSSLATIQSMNQPQPFNQPLNLGGELGGSSNLSLLQGFGFPTFGSQQHQPIQQTHFLELGNREKTVNIYPSAASGPSSQQNWHQPQGFISGNNPTVSEAALWSINDSSASATTNTTTINATFASLNPNQWPDLPGYGPPP